MAASSTRSPTLNLNRTERRSWEIEPLIADLWTVNANATEYVSNPRRRHFPTEQRWTPNAVAKDHDISSSSGKDPEAVGFRGDHRTTTTAKSADADGKNSRNFRRPASAGDIGDRPVWSRDPGLPPERSSVATPPRSVLAPAHSPSLAKR